MFFINHSVPSPHPHTHTILAVCPLFVCFVQHTPLVIRCGCAPTHSSRRLLLQCVEWLYQKRVDRSGRSARPNGILYAKPSGDDDGVICRVRSSRADPVQSWRWIYVQSWRLQYARDDDTYIAILHVQFFFFFFFVYSYQLCCFSLSRFYICIFNISAFTNFSSLCNI